MYLLLQHTESVETRFERFFDLNTAEAEHAAIAALSYPRFKNKWLSCLESDNRDKVLELFKTVISKQINEKPQQITSVAKKRNLIRIRTLTTVIR